MKQTKKLLSLLLALTLVLGTIAVGFGGLPLRSSAAGSGKAIQLVTDGTAANLPGAQQSNVYFGNYKQSSNGAGDFNVDPIKWRVLSNADGKLFLLSDQNLDAMQYYSEQDVIVNWEYCIIRPWLNGDFFSAAFSDAEQAAIPEVVVINDDNPFEDSDGGNNTTDKVFLLSIDEAMKEAYGFPNNADQEAAIRQATNTDYAKDRGVKTYSNGYGVWWLRSPGGVGLVAVSTVMDDGRVDYVGALVDHTDIAVRPAMNVDLSKVLFASAAVGGKAGTGLTAVGDYDGADWKLTLLDESRSSFTASAARLGDEWRIIYSGAATGENERISAMIVNSDGEATYYGVLSYAQTGTNTVTLNTAGKLNERDKLYVFNEQVNAANQTDFASALVEITDAPVFHEIPKCDLATLNDGDYWFDIQSLLKDENINPSKDVYNFLQNYSFFYVSEDGSSALIQVRTSFLHEEYIEHTYTARDARFAYLKQHVKTACDDVLFTEEFESNPTGWTYVDADNDGYNWKFETVDLKYKIVCSTHSGLGRLYSESYVNGHGALTPDNWAITPAIVIPEEDKDVTLTFWVTGQEPGACAEHYGVYVYEAADPAAPALPAGKPADYMKTKLMEQTDDRGKEFTEITVDLSAYAGKTVFLAFRHFDCTDQYQLSLDSVTVMGYHHTYGDTGADRYTCTVCGALNETRKAAILVDPGLTVTVSSATVYHGRTAIVTANLPADATGTVDFALEGQDIDIVYPITGVPLWNGSATVSDDVYDVGNYHVKAKYSGDDKYKAAEAEAYLAVIRNEFALDLTMQNGDFTIPYGQPAVVIVTIPEDATHQAPASGDITLTLNGSAVGTYDAENGVLAFDFTENEKLAPGDYTVHATYNGDAHYAPQEDEITFVVTEATPKIMIAAEPLDEVGTAYAVAITKPEDAVGHVTLHVNYNGEEKDVRVCAAEFFEDGVFSFNFPEDIPECVGLTGEFTLTADYNGSNDPNYTNNSDEITIRLGCDHVWNEPAWNWEDDVAHPTYYAECSKCADGKAEGSVESVPGTRVAATLNEDAYTPYTAQVVLGTQTFTSEYKDYEPGTMHQARADALEDYKTDLIETAESNAQAGDSEKVQALIAAAVERINGVTYDPDLSLDENKQAADNAANLDALADALTDQRAADGAEKVIDEIGEVEYTDESKSRIDAARAAFDALTPEQQALVPDEVKQALEDAEADYQLLEDKAAFEDYKDAVKAAADALGKADDSEKTAALIEKAKKAIDDLPYDENASLDENKQAVDDAANLQQLTAGLDDQRAADAVENAINDIGNVALTDESKGKIDTARAAYDALTDAQKALVPDEAKQALTDAEQEYADREAFEEYKEEKKAALDALAKEGDSAAAQQIIEDAKAEIDALEYDDTKPLEENKAAVDAVVDKTEPALDEQRTADCPLCGKGHENGFFDKLLGVFHKALYYLNRFGIIAIKLLVQLIMKF